ncbi:uncharacterized protein BP01DRAFT_42148 [Aspergillus saccharolyticus JOP 1030-1]|uniref:Basic proline-rich protein n=1 Tax=Aspergillus saccharolyticus JOP 1030-1 TaxID=1450539 RepID=A0A318ZDB4_9EURO|nr:hypothetical protein BP01DRAFT_42148 [Aspergillus saccharolyticus JOP 1030-1]PYH45496.1 hypothetical protein BP01DRAFT_42148 [Aspergillus saccharolyticus JOP 1030-1]
MEASHPTPEGIMLPPSPVDSAGSVDSTSSGSTVEHTTEPERSDHVTITLSLTPDSPVQTPSRASYTRSHFRSRSMIEVPGVPPMTRAHSSPGLDSRGRYIFVNGRGGAANVSDNSARRYLPLQVNTEESPDSRMMPLNVSQTISENGELDTRTASSPSKADYHPTSPVLAYTLPRVNRRRPLSPLHFHPPTSPGSSVMGSPSPAHSSPVMLSSRFNETFPGYSASSTSSIPSTPTSLRSRSPSISSLETIPDIPDAEAAAIEADRIAALKAAADKADEAEEATNTSRRRGTSDASGPSSPFMNMRGTSGGYGVRTDKRKRWSVCGAERRQDLDLETIWED